MYKDDVLTTCNEFNILLKFIIIYYHKNIVPITTIKNALQEITQFLYD